MGSFSNTTGLSELRPFARAGVWCILFATPALAAPDFATDIRPIFERSCYGCHGPEKQKSNYRLDHRAKAHKGGNSGEPAIIPHNAKDSPLIRYVSGADPDMLMPPESSNITRLTSAEIGLLRAWIDAGPSWPNEFAGATNDEAPHWSLTPLERPEKPAADGNAIDAFVHATLSAQGIAPSPEADRRTLIRRISYDLVGLPPAPEEVDAFIADTNPLAYENLVDRLLASPRHGERWARHWLDTIHFADSHGYEHDVARDNAWRYRDYVIAAFNGDTPWQRFIREQLATDVFYPDETQQTPALGFLGAGTFDLSTYSTAEVTFDYLDRDDMVTQTMAAFVSTTANCARCHAHKFDPISQEDYYALQAVFSGVLKGDVAFDAEPAAARERKRWIGIIAAADTNDATVLLAAEYEPLVRDWTALRGAGAAWGPLDLETFLSAEGATQTRGADGVIVSGGNRPDKDTYTITATTALTEITAIRLDVITLDSLPMKGPGRNDNGNFHLSEFEARVFDPGAAESRALTFLRATADFNQDGWGIERAIDGKPDTAWGIHPAVGESHHAVFELSEKVSLAPGSKLAVTIKQEHGGGHVIGAYRLTATADEGGRAEALPATVVSALAVAEADRTEAQRTAIAGHALRSVAQHALATIPEQSYVYAAAKSVAMPVGEPAPQLKSLEEPKVVHLMERGDIERPKQVVGPGALSALTHLPARFALDEKGEGARRAALADWIAHPDNVLTWRSVVNRVWHYHFGRGICDTPSDFGEMGGEPSHPELLDWLTVWFRDDAKGSLKQLHRLIVTSETYRQSSAHREDAASIDAGNRLLWRQNAHRLDADAYRDFTLSISGRLDLAIGGPSVQHFTHSKGPQLTPALDYKAYDWNSPGAGRRSIYRFVWRGIADPFMEALDFPDLGLLAPTRGFSASSLQALTLYNNAFVLAHSEALARRVEADVSELERSGTTALPAGARTGQADGMVTRAVRLVWLRDPTDGERAAFNAFADAQGLPALCRVLLNSNEFLFVD
ncbi:MAG: PSD1 and planctomycete cytochrome C domain-containing protein [Candidatus Hydrogenedentes bacterium]|nr:PSD1 and planctomycete cytochrome C domain-containing protein [Candidatus Hydrogenedentota bacterium]